MTNPYLTIDPFLTSFVKAHGAGKPAAVVSRIEYLDALLRRCLEEQDDEVQCVECRARLSIEKVFNSVNPFATAMWLDRLLWALGYFVHSPWLRSDTVMQAEQWRFVKAIVESVVQTPHFREYYLTPDLARQITMLRDHVRHGLQCTSQLRGPRAPER